MSGLTKRRTSKRFGFLRDEHNAARASGVTIGLLLILLLVVYAHAQDSQSITAERMDAHTVLFTFEGKQYMGFDLERSKELKKAENDAVAFKSELQDEKVKFGKLEFLYNSQSTLFAACMKSSENGPKILGDWRIDLAFKSAPIVTSLVRRCG